MLTASRLSILLILRGINGDSVTQTEGSVTLFEGTPLTLNCTYQSSYTVFVFWYVQHQNKAPQLLLKSLSENQRAEHHGFHASLVKSDSSFHLQKRSKPDRSISLTITALQLRDSAVYFCALRDTTVMRHLWEPHKNLRSQASPSYGHQGERWCGRKKRGAVPEAVGVFRWMLHSKENAISLAQRTYQTVSFIKSIFIFNSLPRSRHFTKDFF
ncbi:Hypothetical predicted protein [Lynx pardinus]|uniref:Ig-like domain-containing protein n=1 Tax=Lynx pardinus TaxID=191816 RepID=A0A485NVW8_LYNPA|nr:Hypothetical predicted protein [Lynx pardinus]